MSKRRGGMDKDKTVCEGQRQTDGEPDWEMGEDGECESRTRTDFVYTPIHLCSRSYPTSIIRRNVLMRCCFHVTMHKIHCMI